MFQGGLESLSSYLSLKCCVSDWGRQWGSYFSWEFHNKALLGEIPPKLKLLNICWAFKHSEQIILTDFLELLLTWCGGGTHLACLQISHRFVTLVNAALRKTVLSKGG